MLVDKTLKPSPAKRKGKTGNRDNRSAEGTKKKKKNPGRIGKNFKKQTSLDVGDKAYQFTGEFHIRPMQKEMSAGCHMGIG